MGKVNFISWHYNQGTKLYLDCWRYRLGWVGHNVSFKLLLKTLFSPWKRMVIEEKTGFNLQKLVEKISFNLISRGIGMVVRSLFIFWGMILWLVFLIGGGLGLFLWVLLPFLGLSTYWQSTKTGVAVLAKLIKAIKNQPEKAVKLVFSSLPGQFVLNKTGLELKEDFKLKPGALDAFAPQSFKELIVWLIANLPDLEKKLSAQELEAEDLVLAASWWDQREIKGESASWRGKAKSYGRPGIGLELLFGYTPNLNKYVTDLTLVQPFSHRLIGRQEIVNQMEGVLSSGNSVFLVGQPGVGKKTVVLEFARRASQGDLGKKMSYRRVLELDYSFLLAESVDLDAKKAKLAKLFAEASRAGNIILVIRDLHRLTNFEVEGRDLTDVFAQFLEKGELKIITIMSSVEYERFIAPDARLAEFFKPVEVVSPSLSEAMLILMASAEGLEKQEKRSISIPVLKRVLEGSDQYITEVPFPEKALALLEEAVVHCQQEGGGVVTIEDVNAVLAQKTGISFSRLTGQEKDRLGKLEEIIHQRLVNQEAAVSLVAKSLRARSVGVKSESRPVGSFLFLGPTGVGKTQTAKVLAQVYYGSEENILRFDMAEYSGSNGLTRLIGSVEQSQPGALTTAIKNKPASLLLLDEIEKATPEIINFFLALLDEGSITDAYGRKISCRHLFVIGTSNAGAEYIRQLVSKGVTGKELQDKLLDYVQKEHLFSPEFLNRFDGVVVYKPLKPEHLVKIARLMLEELQDKLKKKNIELGVTNQLCQKIAQDGYQPALGARPMRRIIDLILGDVLGRAILKDEVKSGDKIKIIPGQRKEEYFWERIS